MRSQPLRDAAVRLRPDLLACPECDLLHAAPRGADRRRHAHCRRCGAPLVRAGGPPADVPLALALAAVIALVIAHLYPVLAIEAAGQTRSASLWEAAVTLWDEDAGPMSLLVLLTTGAGPLAELLAVLYVLLPLRAGQRAPGAAVVLRAMQAVRPWVMVEVFMLGVLVAVVKLAALATILPGIGLWAFAAVMLLLAATASTLDVEALWSRLHATPPAVRLQRPARISSIRRDPRRTVQVHNGREDMP